jgi:hypothetical protein
MLAGFRRGVAYLEAGWPTNHPPCVVLSARLLRDPACDGLYSIAFDWLAMSRAAEIAVVALTDGAELARCSLGEPERLRGFDHTAVKSDALYALVGRDLSAALASRSTNRGIPVVRLAADDLASPLCLRVTLADGSSSPMQPLVNVTDSARASDRPVDVARDGLAAWLRKHDAVTQAAVSSEVLRVQRLLDDHPHLDFESPLPGFALARLTGRNSQSATIEVLWFEVGFRVTSIWLYSERGEELELALQERAHSFGGHLPGLVRFYTATVPLPGSAAEQADSDDGSDTSARELHWDEVGLGTNGQRLNAGGMTLLYCRDDQ